MLSVGLLLAAVPAQSQAHEKRTDKCGCHHQYGLRHCHPNKATPGCEAPAKATAPPAEKPRGKDRTRL